MVNNHLLQVEAISCGTVIDHIPAQIGFKLLSMFKLTQIDQRMTIGFNLPSRKLGKKDIIKLENTFITTEQANELAMYAPHATVNCIQNFQVAKKISIILPEQINEVLICPNRNCISNHEPVNSSFSVQQRQNKEIILTCQYCEKNFDRHAVINNMLYGMVQ